jgi:nucleotide-binding universal stress UspA family protein
VKSYRRLVVATDFSTGSQAAIGAVEAVSGKGPLTVHLIHVLAPIAYMVPSAPLWLEHEQARREDARLQLERFGAALEKRLRGSARVRAHLVGGPPAMEICRLADTVRADLVIVGSHGRTGLRRALIGSVAERVVRHAARPVLIVPVAGSHRRRRA